MRGESSGSVEISEVGEGRGSEGFKLKGVAVGRRREVGILST